MRKKEDRLSDLLLLRETGKIEWPFQLLQHNERDHDTRLAMAPLIAKVAYSCFEYDRQLLKVMPDKGAAASRACIENGYCFQSDPVKFSVEKGLSHALLSS